MEQTAILMKIVVPRFQCDQIWRFIGLWATFKSFWQQLIYPNLSHSQGIFVKESKSIIFPVKSFLGNVYVHLAIFFWLHCKKDSGCATVDSAVTSYTRGPVFKSSDWQLLVNIYLLLTVCSRDENVEKEVVMVH